MWLGGRLQSAKECCNSRHLPHRSSGVHQSERFALVRIRTHTVFTTQCGAVQSSRSCMLRCIGCMLIGTCCTAWYVVWYGACCVGHGALCMLYAVCFMLHVAQCMLYERLMLHAAWCIVHVVCRMLHVAGCMNASRCMLHVVAHAVCVASSAAVPQRSAAHCVQQWTQQREKSSPVLLSGTEQAGKLPRRARPPPLAKPSAAR